MKEKSKMKKSEVLDIMNITQEQFDEIKKDVPYDKITMIYYHDKTKVSLLKTKKQCYQFINTYGDKPFTECFKEMVDIAYKHIM